MAGLTALTPPLLPDLSQSPCGPLTANVSGCFANHRSYAPRDPAQSTRVPGAPALLCAVSRGETGAGVTGHPCPISGRMAPSSHDCSLSSVQSAPAVPLGNFSPPYVGPLRGHRAEPLPGRVSPRRRLPVLPGSPADDGEGPAMTSTPAPAVFLPLSLP